MGSGIPSVVRLCVKLEGDPAVSLWVCNSLDYLKLGLEAFKPSLATFAVIASGLFDLVVQSCLCIDKSTSG